MKIRIVIYSRNKLKKTRLMIAKHHHPHFKFPSLRKLKQFLKPWIFQSGTSKLINIEAQSYKTVIFIIIGPYGIPIWRKGLSLSTLDGMFPSVPTACLMESYHIVAGRPRLGTFRTHLAQPSYHNVTNGKGIDAEHIYICKYTIIQVPMSVITRTLFYTFIKYITGFNKRYNGAYKITSYSFTYYL